MPAHRRHFDNAATINTGENHAHAAMEVYRSLTTETGPSCLHKGRDILHNQDVYFWKLAQNNAEVPKTPVGFLVVFEADCAALDKGTAFEDCVAWHALFGAGAWVNGQDFAVLQLRLVPAHLKEEFAHLPLRLLRTLC